MARIPYLPADVAEPADLVQAIRARRGGTLLDLDRMLLHSPPLARAWNVYLGAVRGDLVLDAKLRELAICAVAVLNGARYELDQHGPLLLRAGGTEAQLEALRSLPSGEGGRAFDETERAVLRLTHEMTRDVSVRDPTFEAVAAALGDRGVVELVAVVATYNMVSRLLVALQIEPD